MNLFITGTDTGVGKTYITKLLLSALTRTGQSAVGFKPIACGNREDAEIISSASNPSPTSVDTVNPIFLKTPVAPMAAASIEGITIDINKIKSTHLELTKSYNNVLTEGAGGWAVPIDSEYSMGDLAADLGDPVLIVVNNKLGALNQTILTANAVRSMGLELMGIILNHINAERDTASITNRAVLEDIINPPIILDILHEETEIDWPF
ncbi:MAG TPA: dethiobiotin synthase [Verrucomicrobia bacterium]|nr:dethiobiotin synthase [Verrucomicrobiales bacterium]HIL54852.1 dethiobiotin synthase [Verrucomicrobiota bacterium]